MIHSPTQIRQLSQQSRSWGESAYQGGEGEFLRCTIRPVRACTFALPELTLAMIATLHTPRKSASYLNRAVRGRVGLSGPLVVLHIFAT